MPKFGYFGIQNWPPCYWLKVCVCLLVLGPDDPRVPWGRFFKTLRSKLARLWKMWKNASLSERPSLGQAALERRAAYPTYVFKSIFKNYGKRDTWQHYIPTYERWE
jgi:hypothetical protein